MNGSRRSAGLESLPGDWAVRIDGVCDRFESEWKSGGRPRVGEYAGEIPDEFRPALLRLLVPLDLEYRRLNGEDPSAREYAGLFRDGPPDWLRHEVDSDRAGRYRLGGELGRGGMGVVYRGIDPDLDRELAIKVLSAEGRDNPAVRGRFLREARITARLQHPNIPPVHEHGDLPDGRPYFAMKLVHGRTLQELLASREHSSASRPENPTPVAHAAASPDFIRLFESVCHGVGYAHSQGILHRDLKPRNVMVGKFGEVQVMDWGLAKVLSDSSEAGPAEATDRGDDPEDPLTTLPLDGTEDATQAGAVMGTLPYLPPEQARGEVASLDRRCDVFSLGAILCQILTGFPPYRGPTGQAILTQARAADLSDAWARLDACGADADLVALCKQCLAANREDRPTDGGAVAAQVAAYQAAVEERLKQAELERVRLEGERAKAELRAAEQRKRRKVQLALAAAVLLLAAGGGAFAWWDQRRDAQQARIETDKARAHAERLAAEADKARAEANERVAREGEAETNLFMREALGGTTNLAQPGQKPGTTRTVKEALDDAARSIAARFRGRPKVEATVRTTVGSSYLQIGAWPEARRQFEIAREIYTQEYDADHHFRYVALENLAAAIEAQGDRVTAERMYRDALAGLERTRGKAFADTLRCVHNLACLLTEKEELGQAEELYRRALNGYDAAGGKDAFETLQVANNLALLLRDKGELAEAEALHRRALDGFEASRGFVDQLTLTAASNLAGVLRARGKNADAEQLRRRVLKGEEELYGPNHDYTLQTTHNLGALLYDDRQFSAAAELFEKAYRGYAAKQRATEAFTSRSMLGLALLRLGKPAVAEPHLRAGYDWFAPRQPLSDRNHNRLRWVTEGLAEACEKTGQPGEAKQWREKLATLSPEVAPPPRVKK